MRIAQVAPLWMSVPPEKYGGTERVVYSLTEGLVQQQHEVTLFACGTSKTSARLVATYPRPLIADNISWSNIMYPLMHITAAFDREKEFDIIHVHLNKASDYLSLPLAVRISEKVVFTLHFVAPRLKNLLDREKVLQKYANLNFVSISNAQRKGMEFLNWVETVYNGIDIRNFPFNNNPGDYFLWLGKFNADKGVREAILAAKKAGVILHVAGAIDALDSDDYNYYSTEIKPLIDGKQIIYVGELGGEQRLSEFANARGFLNPIQWNEPFGLVMAESMSTGTPVIAFNNGAAPEIIVDGKNGYLVESIDQMVEQIKSISTIARTTVRQRIQDKFTEEHMTLGYLSVYKRILDKSTH